MQEKVILCFLLLFSYPVMALNCDAVRWPFSSNISQVQPIDFEKLPRQHLYNYLFFELSETPEKRVPGLGKKLFYYLGNSELNDDLRPLVEALEWAADLNLAKPRVISRTEICDLVKKTMGPAFESTRAPNSTKQSKKKIMRPAAGKTSKRK